jgi:hypothetical protein
MTGAGTAGFGGRSVAGGGGIIAAPGSMPRRSAIKAAERCLRTAKARNDRNIASWISRFGSLWSLLLFDVLTGTARGQQNMGWPRDIAACITNGGQLRNFSDDRARRFTCSSDFMQSFIHSPDSPGLDSLCIILCTSLRSH